MYCSYGSAKRIEQLSYVITITTALRSSGQFNWVITIYADMEIYPRGISTWGSYNVSDRYYYIYLQHLESCNDLSDSRCVVSNDWDKTI
jgi:hypothetical protein